MNDRLPLSVRFRLWMYQHSDPATREDDMAAAQEGWAATFARIRKLLKNRD